MRTGDPVPRFVFRRVNLVLALFNRYRTEWIRFGFVGFCHYADSTRGWARHLLRN